MIVGGCKMLKRIFIFFTAIICLFIFGGCIGRPRLTKEQIIQFVMDNEELMNKALTEISFLDDYIFLVANTRFRSIDPLGLDIEGLYTSGTIDSRNATKSLDNPILYELLKDGSVRSIGIRRAEPDLGRVDKITFNFNGRGVWDRYQGVYFSKNNVPILHDRTIWENPKPYRNGWVMNTERVSYYTERIMENWFYFERVVR